MNFGGNSGSISHLPDAKIVDYISVCTLQECEAIQKLIDHGFSMAQNVEIQTHDGTLLRGLFFAAGQNAPVVIMSAGVCQSIPVAHSVLI